MTIIIHGGSGWILIESIFSISLIQRHRYSKDYLNDQDPATAKMYEDYHANLDKAVSKSTALLQRHRNRKDTFDQDPTTSSMYDDGHVYTDKAGSLTWKFAGGPTKEFEASSTPKPEAPKGAAALLQRRHRYLTADAFDRDPDTASVYDDQQTYSRPGESWARTPEVLKAYKKE
jgi:hypothetical protein